MSFICINFVEKKDLVELVLQHSQASTPIDSSDSGISPENASSSPPTSRLPSSGSWNDNGIRVSDQVKRFDSGTTLTF